MEIVLMPKVVGLYKKSKGSLKYNAGPYNPITRKEVKGAGSLEKAYMGRSNKGEPFSTKVVNRMADVGFPSDLPVKEISKPKAKKTPFLQKIGEGLISPKVKEGLKLTTERKKR